MKSKSQIIIQVIGIAATLISTGATLVMNWVSEKKMEEMIDEKISEALADRK